MSSGPIFTNPIHTLTNPPSSQVEGEEPDDSPGTSQRRPLHVVVSGGSLGPGSLSPQRPQGPLMVGGWLPCWLKCGLIGLTSSLLASPAVPGPFFVFPKKPSTLSLPHTF